MAADKDLGKYSENDFRKLGWPKAPSENAFEGWKRFDANFQDAEYLQQNGIEGKNDCLVFQCLHSHPAGQFLWGLPVGGQTDRGGGDPPA